MADVKGPEGRVGYFCQMVPPEIPRAMGLTPVRLGCGNAALVQSGEEVLSGEICPLTKSSFAQFLQEDHPANYTECLVIPTACDAKKKLGEVLADYRPVFMFNLPPEQDYSQYADSLVKELKKLVKFLQKSTGRKLKRRALVREVTASQKVSQLAREFEKLRAYDPRCISARDTFLIVQSYHSGMDVEVWLDEARRAYEQSAKAAEDKPSLRPRLVLTGAPIVWPNFKPLTLIETSGADIVADTLCTGLQSLIDPPVCEEHSMSALMRALAQKYVFASACPCFISAATRISRTLDLVSEYNAQGVLHYGLRLCQLFDIEVYKLSEVLRENKVPFMNMRTDYSLEDTEQLRVRLEAFLETLEED
ncbi:MAG: 2-hydroxyacyl-CoA dehydratase family protein [Planctomycetota bacterium]|nr:2-hydroxyacyl-CoA dehydratase family protein [Planctomycetota bacterium]